MGISDRVRAASRGGYWAGMSMLLVGVALLVLWAVPKHGVADVSLKDSPPADGSARAVQLPVAGEGWLHPYVWRIPERKNDRVQVSFVCGDMRWNAVTASRAEVSNRPGTMDLQQSGLLYYSLPDGAQCDSVTVKWVYPPRAWLGVTCGVLISFGLLLLLKQLPVRYQWTLVAAACALASGLTVRVVNDANVSDDGAENFRLACNLATYGVFSTYGSTWRPTPKYDRPAPTYKREPVPPAAASLVILASRALRGVDTESTDALTGHDLYAAKLTNIAWVFCGLLAVWLLAFQVTHSHIAGLLASWLAWVSFMSAPFHINSLYSELAAGTLLTITTFALVWAVKLSSKRHFFLVGALVGLLALTKAMFFHIAIAAAVIVFAVLAYRRLLLRSKSAVHGLACAIVACSAFLLVCGPWLIRNKSLGGSWSIAGRSGWVLLLRSHLNEMTGPEVIGAFWSWGPAPYRDLVSGTPLGASSVDFRPGGRFERLSEAKDMRDVSLVGLALKEYVETDDRLNSQFPAAVRPSRDSEFRRMAVSRIRTNLLGHFRCTVPLVWKGVWSVSLSSEFLPVTVRTNPAYWAAAISALLWLSLVGVALAAVVRRSVPLVVITAPAILMLAAYAGLTQNLVRFSAPAIPIMCVTLVCVVWWTLRMARRRLQGVKT